MTIKVELHDQTSPRRDGKTMLRMRVIGRAGIYERDVPMYDADAPTGDAAAHTSAEIGRIITHDAAKVARQSEFDAAKSVALKVGADEYRIVDTIIEERGTDVELIINAWRAGDGARRPVTLRVIRRDVASLPTNGDLLQMIRNRILEVQSGANSTAARARLVSAAQAAVATAWVEP